MRITRKEFILFGSVALGALFVGGVSWLAGLFGRNPMLNGISLHPAEHWRRG
jgi:hypothetical protein